MSVRRDLRAVDARSVLIVCYRLAPPRLWTCAISPQRQARDVSQSTRGLPKIEHTMPAGGIAQVHSAPYSEVFQKPRRICTNRPWTGGEREEPHIPGWLSHYWQRSVRSTGCYVFRPLGPWGPGALGPWGEVVCLRVLGCITR